MNAPFGEIESFHGANLINNKGGSSKRCRVCFVLVCFFGHREYIGHTVGQMSPQKGVFN